ncbi:MAG TPA: hypothetical protein VN903_02540 [Polyangia bacterium]|nr:hypothetical protein [Polyangia bacterium]
MSFFLTAALLAAPLRARAAEPAVEPLPPAATAPPSVGSLTYVKSLGHLEEITSRDNLLHPRALALSHRVYLGTGVMMGSVAAGALIIVAAATMFQQTECITPSTPPGFDLPVSPICQSHTNETMAVAGMVTGIVGGLTGLLLMPSQGEAYDIINEWNARHPEQTLLIPPSHSHH